MEVKSLEGASACPVCGSSERVIGQIIADLKEEGKLSEEMFPKGPGLQINLFDPKKAALMVSPTVKIPLVTVFFDVCARCHSLYCTGVDFVEAPAQVSMGPMPPRFRGEGPGPS